MEDYTTTIEFIDLGEGWTFHVFIYDCDGAERPVSFIQQHEICSRNTNVRASLYPKVLQAIEELQIDSLSFSTEGAKSIKRAAKHADMDFSFRHKCYDLPDAVLILRHPKVASKIPSHIADALEKRIAQAQTRKRKRDDSADEPPKLWPGYQVEYGNAMRIVNGFKAHDYPLPPVSPKIELFELPPKHPAYGSGSNLGVRAVQDIPKGEIVCHYAGVVEPRFKNGLANLYVMHDHELMGDTQHNALVFGNEARFINAPKGLDKEANVAFDKFTRLPFTDVSSCQVRALVDINEGDELLVEYGEQYWNHDVFKQPAKSQFSDFAFLHVTKCEIHADRKDGHRMHYYDHTLNTMVLEAAACFGTLFRCWFKFGDKTYTVDLIPEQYRRILRDIYPDHIPGRLVEILALPSGKITKVLCYFKQFVLTNEEGLMCEVVPYADPEGLYTVTLDRLRFPKLRRSDFLPAPGETVFVLGNKTEFNMATVIDVDSNERTARVQVLGEFDKKHMCPVIRRVKLNEIFEK